VLAKSMGVEARLVQMPFKKLLPALEAGELELVLSGVTITPARSERVEFVGPYYTSGKTVLTKDATLAAAPGPEALDSSKLQIAVLAGSTSEEFVKRSMPKATLVPVESLDAAIAKVVSDEVDALVAERETCAYAVLRNPDRGLLASDAALTVEPMGIAVQAGDPRFAHLVQIYLDALRERGVVEKARDFWLKDPSWVKGLK
jgi:polar amino acid transport system substrate-binding protein